MADPQWCCSRAACGLPINVQDRHVTVVRNLERATASQAVTVFDAETVAMFHEQCAPAADEVMPA